MASTKNRVPLDPIPPTAHQPASAVLPVRLHVAHRRTIVHDEARRLPSPPVCAMVMVWHEDVDARRSRKAKTASRRADARGRAPLSS